VILDDEHELGDERFPSQLDVIRGRIDDLVEVDVAR